MPDDDFSDLHLTVDFNDDPKPKKTPRKSVRDLQDKKPKRPVGRPSTKSLEKEAQDSIEAFIALCALGLSPVCQECSKSIIESAGSIAEPAARIALRNPKLLQWINQGGDAIDWFKLAVALAGPTRQVWNHHIKTDKEQEFEDATFAA